MQHAADSHLPSYLDDTSDEEDDPVSAENSVIDDVRQEINSMHVVLRRHPAAVRAAPRIREIVQRALSAVAPDDRSMSTRVTIAWKLPESLESILSRLPRT